MGCCQISQGHYGLCKRHVKAAYPCREHKHAPGRSQWMVLLGNYTSFSEKIYNKVVSKGVKKDPALTVVGTI